MRHSIARMHDNIGDYISGCSPRVVPLLEELWNYVHATLPGATEDTQYGAPVFLNANASLAAKVCSAGRTGQNSNVSVTGEMLHL